MINRNLAKILANRYIILASLLLIAALGLLLLPAYQKNERVTAEDLLAKVVNPERYVTSDDLAHKIITKDPSILLIDLRDEKEYAEYSLTGALNIPFDAILNADYEAYLNQGQYDIVLFSNDDFKADQAWLILTRMDYENLHVLQGGIKGWYNTILNPPEPTENMAKEAFELYDFRKAAAMYFGVGIKQHNQVEQQDMTPKKVVIPIVKKKKRKPEGGC
ncbi:rhodanese-like domain-containing protein [Maribacter sp. ANRC-HE7]|uniref:Rhodanese-like domain-containing protein n=1 Tax=Maribacter aquimaris TaxID=2737171 RepID=A0ABR7UW69_9FLAO|nr:rhodanese-like domain-containing protein [Maribacter aquimaris]MBD0776321.1 rhodanese-like domain-containing protein [Maribacter aquimaris]